MTSNRLVIANVYIATSFLATTTWAFAWLCVFGFVWLLFDILVSEK